LVVFLALFPVAAATLITVGALDAPGEACDVEAAGDLAYVAADLSGLRVIEVSHPASESPGLNGIRLRRHQNEDQ
jgi:hypothetical protein